MYFSSQKFVYQQFFGMRTKYKQFHWFSSLLTKRDACTNTAQSSLRGVQMMMIATIRAEIKSIQMCVCVMWCYSDEKLYPSMDVT